jgi:hypothetical protein
MKQVVSALKTRKYNNIKEAYMSKISLQQPYREIEPLSCKVPKCTLRYSFILLFDYNRQGGGINGFKIFWREVI